MKRALEIARDIREGRCTAVSVAEDAITRIDAIDPRINSFVTRTSERARAEAAAIDRRRMAGETLPPLAGVPYAVKNLFDVEGVVTLAGAWVNAANAPAARDAALVERMRDAGAVLLGTLNMDEHAYGFTTENTHYGATRNPRDLSRTAGGSSGGSAAAIAAGLVPITLGSDTNGSIRVPASLCGTFGLKATYGRLSRRGSFPFVASLDHVGPFAASAADLAAAYDALQSPDPADPACAQRPVEACSMPSAPSVAPSRIAVLGGYFEQWATHAARRAVALAAEALGASARVELTGAAQARAAAFVVTAAEAGALHRPWLTTRYDEFEPHSRDRLVAGSLVPAAWVVHAQRVRRAVYDEAMRLFERYDVLLAPATPMQAPPLGTETVTINGVGLPCRPSIGLLTQPISCIGLPVCVVPVWPRSVGDGARVAGTTAGALASGPGGTLPDLPDLPIGIQIIAAPWREDRCLAVARQLEEAGIATSRIY